MVLRHRALEEEIIFSMAEAVKWGIALLALRNYPPLMMLGGNGAWWYTRAVYDQGPCQRLLGDLYCQRDCPFCSASKHVW